VKLPLINKLSAVTGVFARLNPMGLIAKLKARKKGGGSDEDEDRDFLPSGGDGDGDELFADLGDLDQLDADAKEKGEEGGREDFDDFDNEELDEFNENEFDDEKSDLHEPAHDQDDDDDIDFSDLDEPDPEMTVSASDKVMDDLADFSVGGGFDDDDDDDEEDDDEEAQKAKLKKLLMLAGGGVAVAMVIGGLAWWLLGGDQTSAPTEEVAAEGQIPPPEGAGGLVISLDDIAPAAQPTSSVHTPAPAYAPAPTAESAGGLAPPTGGPGEAPSPLAPVVDDQAPQSELARLGLDVQMEPGVGVVIPSTTNASYEKLAPWPAAEPLQVAPVATLVEPGEHGLLPKIGPEGDTPFDAYARPESQTKSGNPKIAVIITGVGMSRASTEAAISTTPADVALSLDVYARGLDFWVKRARAAGHEVLLNMPSESSDFPFSDPGPNALKALATPDQNIQQLEWILSQTTGYFGVLSVYGSKFLTVEEQLKAIVEELKKRGLMYVDGGAEDSLGTRVAYQVGAKWATVELTLDANPGRAALERQFQELEALAKKRAIAIARVSASPLALERLAAWLKTFDQKGLQLVPLSSLANKQLIR